MQTLILYCILVTLTLVAAVKQYFTKMDELNKLNNEVLKLQIEQNNLISAISQQGSKIYGSVNESIVTNIYFYVFVSGCVIIVLGICYIYFSSAPTETVAEAIAKNLPNITKISTDATLNAVERTTVLLSDKLHSVESNIEKLGFNTAEIALKCLEIESKTNELITKFTGENSPYRCI